MIGSTVSCVQVTLIGMLCRWSAKNGEFPAGDPELHHVAGQLYAEGMVKHDISGGGTCADTAKLASLTRRKDI